MTLERTSIRGVVETVFYSGPTFSAGRLRTADGEFVKFAGKVFVKIERAGQAGRPLGQSSEVRAPIRGRVHGP